MKDKNLITFFTKILQSNFDLVSSILCIIKICIKINGRLEKDILSKLKVTIAKQPLCFATTVLTGSPIKDVLDVSRIVKQLMPELPVVWSGWHLSLFPEQTLAEPSIDVKVRSSYLEILIYCAFVFF